MDLIETGHEYRLVLEVPGARPEDVVTEAGPFPGSLTIRARVETPQDAHDAGSAIRVERGDGRTVQRFARTVPVGWDADVARAQTRVENGLLTVRVPRRRDAREPDRQVAASRDPAQA